MSLVSADLVCDEGRVDDYDIKAADVAVREGGGAVEVIEDKSRVTLPLPIELAKDNNFKIHTNRSTRSRYLRHILSNGLSARGAG